MRKLIGRRDMKIKPSKHFLLMHDTPDTLDQGQAHPGRRAAPAPGNRL